MLEAQLRKSDGAFAEQRRLFEEVELQIESLKKKITSLCGFVLQFELNLYLLYIF